MPTGFASRMPLLMSAAVVLATLCWSIAARAEAVSNKYGVNIAVDSVERLDAGVKVHLKIINGSKYAINLNHPVSDTKVVATDGTVLMLSPPPANKNLEVAQGELLEGDLTFMGFLGKDVKTVDILFNAERAVDDKFNPGLSLKNVPVAPEASTETGSAAPSASGSLEAQPAAAPASDAK